jgi:transposase
MRKEREEGMKQDGRKLDHRTLEVIRKMAVQRVGEGEKPSEVIASYGFSRSVIYRCLKAAKGRGKGLRALASHKGTGRPRKLMAEQERQVFRWINGKTPQPYQREGVLWSRAIVRELIQREFGVSLSLASVGALLARLGLTPQKPLQRAYQRNPEAIGYWKREAYPAIAQEAKETQADIYFWDESGFRAEAVHGKTWGVKGQTPVEEVPGQRQSISAASAVSAKGTFWFSTYTGGMNGEKFVELLKKLMWHRKKPLHLVLDGLPAHKMTMVKDYVSSTNGKLMLHFLPGYAPELNPDERVWSHIKRTGVAKSPLQRGEKLEPRIHDQLKQIQHNPKLVRSFFQHPDVTYISD